MNANHQTTGLFKYLSPAKFEFFEKCLLSLTPPIYFNDPWDFLPKGQAVSEAQLLEAPEIVEAAIAQASVIAVPLDFARRRRDASLQALRKQITTDDFLEGASDNYQQKISKIVGAISLTELPLCRLMWAHYAESYSGFVVEFIAGEMDHYKGFFARTLGFGLPATKVKYPLSAQRVTLNENADNVDELCWSKHPVWEYEQEWRVVAHLHGSHSVGIKDKKGEDRFCVSFPPQSLHRVIFGMRMKPEIKRRLLAMLARPEFEHVQKEVTAINHGTGELVSKAF